VNTGEREIVSKKEGEKKGNVRGSVHWGCYHATALDIEVDPQRSSFGCRESDFALRSRFGHSESDFALHQRTTRSPGGPCRKKTQKLAVHAGGGGLVLLHGPITKLFAWGEGDSGRHVLRETTSRCLCGLVCPSRTSERGGEGDCVLTFVCVCLCVMCVCLLLQNLLQIRVRGWGDSGGHVLRETTSRSLCGLVCPSRTSEHGGEGYCMKEGRGEEGEHERERAREVRLHYSLG
jgi:hypothetical protein